MTITEPVVESVDPGPIQGHSSHSTAAQRVREEIAAFDQDPFLVTVTADGAPHCSPVEIDWEGDRLVVPAPRHWKSLPSQEGRIVTLLYPPATPGGYALIVDGAATGEGRRLSVEVTRAVLHRRGASESPGGSGCGSDCRPLDLGPEA